MIEKRKWWNAFLLLLGVLLPVASHAQDAQFAQFFASPLYLNPGLAGTAPQHRFALSYRYQWPSIPNTFSTYAFSYDYNMRDLSSGVGILAVTDKAGEVGLRHSSLGATYAYKIAFDNWVVAPGIYVGYALRSVDYARLLLGDQIEFDVPGAPSNDPVVNSLQNIGYFDVASGVVAYNSFFWGGISFFHMHEPNVSLIQSDTRLPMKFSVHSGVRIPLYNGVFDKNRIPAIAPSFIYKRQGSFDQLDVGMHFFYKPLFLGLWYRGIPIAQTIADNVNQDAVTFLLGAQINYNELYRFEVGYSYDLTVSDLGLSSGGAHEISIVYTPIQTGKRKKKYDKRNIRCPVFISY